MRLETVSITDKTLKVIKLPGQPANRTQAGPAQLSYFAPNA